MPDAKCYAFAFPVDRMKTNRSYKLVLHKKGFGGSGKQESCSTLLKVIRRDV